MINKDELIYKLEAIIEYLKNNGGYDYELYNRLCPGMGEPDSNIVEYAEDIFEIVNKLIDNKYYNYITKIKGLDELTSFALDFFTYDFFIDVSKTGFTSNIDSTFYIILKPYNIIKNYYENFIIV